MEITHNTHIFTPETINQENQQWLSDSHSFVVLLIHIIKSYMINISPHLIHNPSSYYIVLPQEQRYDHLDYVIITNLLLQGIHTTLYQSCSSFIRYYCLMHYL